MNSTIEEINVGQDVFNKILNGESLTLLEAFAFMAGHLDNTDGIGRPGLHIHECDRKNMILMLTRGQIEPRDIAYIRNMKEALEAEWKTCDKSYIQGYDFMERVRVRMFPACRNSYEFEHYYNFVISLSSVELNSLYFDEPVMSPFVIPCHHSFDKMIENLRKYLYNKPMRLKEEPTVSNKSKVRCDFNETVKIHEEIERQGGIGAILAVVPQGCYPCKEASENANLDTENIRAEGVDFGNNTQSLTLRAMVENTDNGLEVKEVSGVDPNNNNTIMGLDVNNAYESKYDDTGKMNEWYISTLVDTFLYEDKNRGATIEKLVRNFMEELPDTGYSADEITTIVRSKFRVLPTKIPCKNPNIITNQIPTVTFDMENTIKENCPGVKLEPEKKAKVGRPRKVATVQKAKVGRPKKVTPIVKTTNKTTKGKK